MKGISVQRVRRESYTCESRDREAEEEGDESAFATALVSELNSNAKDIAYVKVKSLSIPDMMLEALIVFTLVLCEN